MSLETPEKKYHHQDREIDPSRVSFGGLQEQDTSALPLEPDDLQAAYEKGYAEAERATIDFMLTSRESAASIAQNAPPRRTRRTLFSSIRKKTLEEKHENNDESSMWNRLLQTKATRRAAVLGAVGVGYSLARVTSHIPTVAEAEEFLFGKDPAESTTMEVASNAEAPLTEDKTTQNTTENDAYALDRTLEIRADKTLVSFETFNGVELKAEIAGWDLYLKKNDLLTWVQAIGATDQDITLAIKYFDPYDRPITLTPEPKITFTEYGTSNNRYLYHAGGVRTYETEEINAKTGEKELEKTYVIPGIDLYNPKLSLQVTDGKDTDSVLKEITLQKGEEFPAHSPDKAENSFMIISPSKINRRYDIENLAEAANRFLDEDIWRVFLTDAPLTSKVQLEGSNSRKKVLLSSGKQFDSSSLGTPGLIQLTHDAVSLILRPESSHYDSISKSMEKLGDMIEALDKPEPTQYSGFQPIEGKDESDNIVFTPSSLEPLFAASYKPTLSGRSIDLRTTHITHPNWRALDLVREFVATVRYAYVDFERDFVSASDENEEIMKPIIKESIAIFRTINDSEKSLNMLLPGIKRLEQLIA